MIYDLTIPLHRKQFVKRANRMLERQSRNAELGDHSKRTLKQNSYYHVLCRILAIEVGVTERYAEDVYFKQMANPGLFIVEEIDKLTGLKMPRLRSTTELTIEEMSRAINTFRHWSEEQGYYLPEANADKDGNMEFATEDDEKAFHQAELETSRLENYIE